MPSKNQDFLKFSAYSIKDLITRKLSESTKFTDQIYEGSNLAILIDIFSHMAQCLMYSLNNTAGESMFSDTQIYENINRLVKFIGYNPKGVSTATINLTLDQRPLFSADNSRKEYEIYKYSAIDTGKTDSNGQRIYYSTVENKQTTANDTFQTLFYNGLWKLYPTIFTSNGLEYQTFVLDSLRSNAEEKKYVVDGMVHVYVLPPNHNKMIQYQMVQDGLFTDNKTNNGSYIYTSQDNIFNLRLNENKQYEITFGNGFNGSIPAIDSQIYVFYMESNGPDGEISPNEINNKNLEHSRTLFGISKEVYEQVFNISDIDKDSNGNITSLMYTPAAIWTNLGSSTTFVAEESVDDIRRSAPQWFRTGNRLVTATDFEYFVRNRFKDNIVDVKCQNNWQYISTFYQWLYNLGLNGKLITKNIRPPLDNYYINQNRLQKADLKYSDSADGNNVYLWIKMKNDSDLYKEQIDSEILNIKSLTQEAVYLSPLTMYFSFCAADIDDALDYLINDNIFDKDNESYLEVTLDDNTLFANNDVCQQVKTIIIEFFNENNFQLGQTIDFSVLANKILNINAVNRIRTIYRNKNTGASRIINGISFATWTPSLIDLGDDLNVSSVSRTLEVFQFPKLYRSADLQSKIKVIRKSISSANSIQY